MRHASGTELTSPSRSFNNAEVIRNDLRSHVIRAIHACRGATLKTIRTKTTGIATVLLTVATATGAVGLGAAEASQSSRSPTPHSITKAITVQITSSVANPGDVVIQDVAGAKFATCVGPKKKGTLSCVVHVPSSKTAVFVAQSRKGAGFASWAGACGSVPGPVCAVFVLANTRVLVKFGAASSKATVAPTLDTVEGDTPSCSGYLDAQTVNAAGFAANTPVTLKDDGHLVASGTTSGTGTAQLSYTTLSEPGIYRILAATAGATTLKTDVYNAGSVCSYWNGIGTGTVNFKVLGTDFDAKSKITIRFGKSTATFAKTGSTGAFTVNTPNYACKAGTMVNLDISAIRGAGTRFSRTFDYAFLVTC